MVTEKKNISYECLRELLLPIEKSIINITKHCQYRSRTTILKSQCVSDITNKSQIDSTDRWCIHMLTWNQNKTKRLRTSSKNGETVSGFEIDNRNGQELKERASHLILKKRLQFISISLPRKKKIYQFPLSISYIVWEWMHFFKKLSQKVLITTELFQDIV